MSEYTDTKLDETIHETKAYYNKMNVGVDHNKLILGY